MFCNNRQYNPSSRHRVLDHLMPDTTLEMSILVEKLLAVTACIQCSWSLLNEHTKEKIFYD